MPSADEFLSKPPENFVLLVLGMPDSGKSDLAMTFPACYVISFDPTGFNILRNGTERGRQLAKNLVHIEPPDSGWGDGDIFKRTTKERTSVFGCFHHVRELAKEGTVKTLVVDGLNYLISHKWNLICNESKNQTSGGDLNRRAAYGDLKIFLNDFMWANLLPLATRNNLNLIVTCHIKRLSIEAVEGEIDKKTNKRISSGKLNKETDLAAIIEGGFASEIDGKFGGVLWLEHRLSSQMNGLAPRKIEHYAYCQKTTAMETIIPAKNKYGLPQRLNITDKSLYDLLMAQMRGETKTS